MWAGQAAFLTLGQLLSDMSVPSTTRLVSRAEVALGHGGTSTHASLGHSLSH